MLLVAAAIAFTYDPVRQFDFVNWDDDQYIVENPRVLGGLTAENIAWAFTTTHVANWHPLTWLSHQLDATWFGARPGPVHVENVLWHILNTWLVLRVLRQLGMSLMGALAITGIFALHPLRVESVAWISERKDLLSACAGLCAVLAYLRYVRQPSAWRMALVAAWQFVSLLCKPMLVTLPVLLLILDDYPLRRWSRPTWRAILGEKWPLIVVSLLFCVIALFAQHAGGALRTIGELPLLDRITNAAAVVFIYLRQTAWPSELACFYPRRVYAWGGAAAVILGLITLAAWHGRASRHVLFSGWLWYLVALLPVVGLVQVGDQAHADRYTYLPQLGLITMLVVSVGRWLPKRHVQAVVVAAVLLMLSWQTSRQVLVWRDSETLFTHCLAVTGEQPLAHFNLGLHLAAHGQPVEAEEHYRRAVALQPVYPKAHNNLGVLLKERGDLPAAVEQFRLAAAQQPGYFAALMNLGQTLDALGDTSGASDALRHAVEAEPLNVRGHTAIGRLLLNQRNLSGAATRLARAIELAPQDPEALLYLGIVRIEEGATTEARTLIERARQLSPHDARVQRVAAEQLARLKLNPQP
ncbi:MAG: tetratricopeptide repeat protein [Planctomycetaceae bacterium]|nr:tetratricopeptide repeat protein [Planctomycetaceae bacterium]